MPWAQIRNQGIYYAARGVRGAPLVLIHGAGDSHLMWNAQLSSLAGVARVLALDLPGHGRSQGPARSSIFEYAHSICEFLDALDLGGVIIVGVSMGGAIAQAIALEHPDRVLALGLVGTGAKLRVAPSFLRGLETEYEATVRILVDNYYTAGAPEGLKEKSRRQLLATGREVTLGDFRACDSFDVIGRLGDIRAPALVMCGREDKMTPVKYSEFLASKLPGSRLEIVEHAGHMVMLEQPTAVNRIMTEWVISLNSLRVTNGV